MWIGENVHVMAKNRSSEGFALRAPEGYLKFVPGVPASAVWDSPGCLWGRIAVCALWSSRLRVPKLPKLTWGSEERLILAFSD